MLKSFFVRRSILVGIAILAFCTIPIDRTIANTPSWGDQGDGTFKNPILPGDFSDPDVIRVDNDYYLITSSFQYSPGMAILHSKDLVNWQYVGHCIDDISQIGPEMNWDRMNRTSRGVFAGSIRYHDGKFWMFTTTLPEGVFMTTADKPAGPWAPLYRITDRKGYDDCCPLWTDDGQAYLVMSQPTDRTGHGDKWCSAIYKMSPDGKTIDFTSRQYLLNPSDPKEQAREANKVYQRNGYYYFFHDTWTHGVVDRSKNVLGPYEERAITPDALSDHTINVQQGALIQTAAGDWYFLTHEPRTAFNGRQCDLVPIHWVDDWPVGEKVYGAGPKVSILKKPVDGSAPVSPQSDDDFNGRLGLQWQWNYQPRADKWSLTERPGWLRLDAFKPLAPGDFFKAGNTLTQTIMGAAGGETHARFDVSGMADGQTAGLSLYWQDVARIGITQANGSRHFVFQDKQGPVDGPPVTTNEVYLQALIDNRAGCTFAYSLDGKTYVPLGRRFAFGGANFRGTRIGLYTWNDNGETGRVDITEFRYNYPGPGRMPENAAK